MSAPVLTACAVVALGIGLPVLSITADIEAGQKAAAVSDASALAAADALNGWIETEPCEIAEIVAESGGARIEHCDTDSSTGAVRITASVRAPLGTRKAVAKAGPPVIAAQQRKRDARSGPTSANGWAWPSQVRGVTQSFHDGFSIDLAAPQGSPLYAPFSGVVVASGADGGGIPEVCRINPSWWRGPNHRVVIRHEYEGRVMYSSHNHVTPGSTGRYGISPGTRVRAGQPVAEAGMSGCTSGPHTHFTLASTPSNAFPDIDPFAYLGAP